MNAEKVECTASVRLRVLTRRVCESQAVDVAVYSGPVVTA